VLELGDRRFALRPADVTAPEADKRPGGFDRQPVVLATRRTILELIWLEPIEELRLGICDGHAAVKTNIGVPPRAFNGPFGLFAVGFTERPR
jgi:hypothetical protein